MFSENSSYFLSFMFFLRSLSLLEQKYLQTKHVFLILIGYENEKHFSKTVNKQTLYFPTMFPSICVIIIQQGLFNQILGFDLKKIKKCQG